MDISAVIDKAGERLGLWPPKHIREHGAAQRKAEGRIADSAAYFASIRNSYAGRRGFVIGNGPSLRMSDLDQLKGEVSIASNKIFLAYPATIWRPTFYTVVDALIWEREAPSLHTHVLSVIIPSYLKVPPRLQVSVHIARTIGNAADTAEEEELPFSSDLTKGIYGGYTVTYENLQLAIHLGLDPIYLIGCDHFYSGTVGQEGASTVGADGAPNHFIPGYLRPGEEMNPALVSRMTRSYQWARRYADLHGIRILNATRGGHLEVFERVDLDEVLGSSS